MLRPKLPPIPATGFTSNPIILFISSPSLLARGAAPQAARLLADKRVILLAAGGFGYRFISELEEGGIEHIQRSGQVSDIVCQLVA